MLSEATVGMFNHWQERDTSGAEGEHIIPSLQALHNTGDIYRKVSQRYQDLENMSLQQDTGTLELLLQDLQNKVQKQQSQKVKWPLLL